MKLMTTLMWGSLVLAGCGSKAPEAPDAQTATATTAPTSATPDAAPTPAGDAKVDPTTPPPTATSAAPDAAAAPADAAPAPADAAPTGPASYFRARIEAPGDMVFTANVTIQGATGTIDIPLQRLEKAPIQDAKVSADAVEFSLVPPGAPPGVAVKFSAKKEGDQFVGDVDQMGMKIPLRLTQVESAADFVPKRPQTPKPPLPYKTEDVKIAVKDAELACTLSSPAGDGPHPVIIMVTGSGPQDRDETIFDHKPFLVLSDAIVRGGVATLRCDDRSVGASTGDLEQADIPMFVADAKAEREWLAARADIDKAHIGALGHSEGGIVVSQLAKDGDLAFVVLLAGPALSGKDVSLRQNLENILAQGVPKEKAAAIEAALDKVFSGIAESVPDEEQASRAKALAEVVVAAVDPSMGPVPPAEQLAEGFVQLAKNKWLNSWVKSKPAETLAGATKVPVLALYGEKDTQVHGADHSAYLKKTFDAQKKENAEVELVLGANHLFQSATTGKLSEYGDLEETMKPTVIERIVTWLQKAVKA